MLLLRYLCLIALLVASAWPARGQPITQATPAAAEQMLLVQPAPTADSTHWVYRTSTGLVFQVGTATRTVALPGPLIAAQTSPQRHRLAVLVQPMDILAKEPSLALHVYRRDGRLQYRHSLPHVVDAPFPALAVSDRSGTAIYGHSARSEVVFLDAQGMEIRRIQLFDDAPYALEKSLHLAYSPDGAFVAVAAMRTPAYPAHPHAADNVHLFVFASDGMLRWQQTLPEQALQALAVSEDGAHLGVATYDPYARQGLVQRTQLFTPDGTLALTVPHGFERLRTASTGDAVLLLTKQEARCYDLPTSRLRFRFVRPAPDVQLIDAALREDGQQSALLLGRSTWTERGFVYEAPRLLHLDPRGQTLAETAVSEQPLQAPLLHALAANRGVMLVLDRSTTLFPWPAAR